MSSLETSKTKKRTKKECEEFADKWIALDKRTLSAMEATEEPKASLHLFARLDNIEEMMNRIEAKVDFIIARMARQAEDK